jgi:hypothetical protein
MNGRLHATAAGLWLCDVESPQTLCPMRRSDGMPRDLVI